MNRVCITDVSGMEANLSRLVDRLEAVASRLETVAGHSSVPAPSSQPMMDSGQIVVLFSVYPCIISMVLRHIVL